MERTRGSVKLKGEVEAVGESLTWTRKTEKGVAQIEREVCVHRGKRIGRTGAVVAKLGVGGMGRAGTKRKRVNCDRMKKESRCIVRAGVPEVKGRGGDTTNRSNQGIPAR